MNKLKLAACGIDCNECGSYKVTMEHDIKAAEGLVAWYKCGCHYSRDFRICCTEKKISHCGECRDFPCEPYIEFVGDLDHHKKAMEYLLSIKQTREGERT